MSGSAPGRADWRRVAFRVITPGLVYRLTAWRRRQGADGGRLRLLEDGPCTARLRWSGPDGDDPVQMARWRAWMLDVVARCGGTRGTLREVRRVAGGESTYEYTVYWTERAQVAVAHTLLPALVAVTGLTVTALRIGVPPAAWLLVPFAGVTAYAVSRQRAARGNRSADAESGAAFRWLLERALAARPEPGTQADVGEAPPPEVSGSGPVVLEKDGEFWRAGYEGTTVMLRHSRGLALLVHLVRSPRRDIHVSELDSITPSGASPVARESPVP